MENQERKEHWENIYQTKELTDVSWYQPVPETSLAMIKKLQVSKDSRMIDVGGGDSFLAEFLLNLGYTNITVLDISANAIEKAKKEWEKMLAKSHGLFRILHNLVRPRNMIFGTIEQHFTF